MFKVDKDDKTTIKCTRGDKGSIIVRKKIRDGEYEPYYPNDKVAFSIKNNFGDSEVVLRKIIEVKEKCDFVTFDFDKNDTSIGELISSPQKYQYDIAVNDDITILGYDDETGPKYFILYPEGSNDN